MSKRKSQKPIKLHEKDTHLSSWTLHITRSNDNGTRWGSDYSGGPLNDCNVHNNDLEPDKAHCVAPGLDHNHQPSLLSSSKKTKKHSKRVNVFQSEAQQYLYSLLTAAYVALPLTVNSDSFTQTNKQNSQWLCHLGSISFTIFPLQGARASTLGLAYPKPVRNFFLETKTVDSQVHLYSYLKEDKHYLYLDIKPDAATNDISGERCYSVELSPVLDISLVESLSCLCKTRKRAGDVIFKSYNETSGEVIADVFLFEGSIQRDVSNSNGFKLELTKSLQIIINHFCSIPISVSHSGILCPEATAEALYQHVDQYHRKYLSTYCADIDVQHSNLKPQLRPYQIDAVRWMLHMERQHQSNKTNDGMHLLWHLVTATDGHQFYYNHRLGAIRLKRPEHMPRIPGGILADEMGLGKTVEVLACILMNRRTDLDSHRSQKEAIVEMDRTVNDSVDCDRISNEHSTMSASMSRKQVTRNNRTTCDYTNDETWRKIVDYSPCHIKTGETLPHQDLNIGRETSEYGAKNIPVSECLDGSIIFNKCPSKPCTTHKPNPLNCICGGEKNLLLNVHRLELVQCHQCDSVQHASCVNYITGNSCHARPYLCPHCCIAAPLFPSAATLIISPSSISHQWTDEIRRHIQDNTLRVFQYIGVRYMGFVQPATLASYDIVITTYDTLRQEINYVGLPHCTDDEGRKLRQAKRYMTTPSPLTAIEWWRVCMDEAQMIGVPTVKAASMALTLSSVNRWCVTGTPIQRGMEDLFGLIVFLGIDPYCIPYLWKTLVTEPHKYGDNKQLFRLATTCLWRSSKIDILDQIGIPDQEVQMHYLKFSPVEQHFYARKFESCSRQARELLNPWPGPQMMSEMCRKQKLVAQLVKLRQACCHPQAVRGEFIPLRKQTMTMEELLVSLIDKTRLECEEAHRVIISSLNGLAALHLIDNQVSNAVEMYRESVNSIRTHNVLLRTDPLQTYHTLHNLKEILDSCKDDSSISQTLLDDTFTNEVDQIGQEYLKKLRSSVSAAELQLEQIRNKLNKLESTYQGHWWLDTITHIADIGRAEELVAKIKLKLTDNMSTAEEFHSISQKFHNTDGLQYIVTLQYEQLHIGRKSVCYAVSQLNHEPPDREIQQAMSCHLRNDAYSTPKPHTNLCPLCKTQKLLAEYEARLFSAKSTGTCWENTGSVEDTNKPMVTWAMSDLEKTLKIISSMGQALSAGVDLHHEGQTENDRFTHMKNEFKSLSALWMSLRDYMSGLDELMMARTRIRLCIDGEEKPARLASHILETYQVEENRNKFSCDKIVSENILKRKLGQLMYLKNLSKAQSHADNNKNPDLCPICDKELGTEWAVLVCAHSFCSTCISLLVNCKATVVKATIRCPICRDVINVNNISYVTTSPQNETENENNIKGSHSTKVYAVVNEIKNILAADPTAKSLVFSTWPDVLQVIEGALVTNEIPCRCLSKMYNFQKYLDAFKTDPSVNILLLPIYIGSKGVNIIEATHVLLVEPLINPAAELQAVGRVHRIGQTKPTTVHKFVIRGTIEERLHWMMQNAKIADIIDPHADDKLFTIDDLGKLFQPDDNSQLH